MSGLSWQLLHPDEVFVAGNGRTLPSLRERVAMNVAALGEDDCWPWQGYRDADDYGTIGVDNKTFKAHRVVFYLTHGGWPTQHACHTCENPPCCNPAHLYDGTPKRNMRDKTARNRDRGPAARNRAATQCVNGHDFSESNTCHFVDAAGQPHRTCRTCAKEHQQRLRDRRKNA